MGANKTKTQTKSTNKQRNQTKQPNKNAPVLGDLALVEADGLFHHVLNLLVSVHVLHGVGQKQLAHCTHLWIDLDRN